MYYTIFRKLNSRNIPVLSGKVYSKSRKLSSISLPLPLPSITCCQFKEEGKPRKCPYKIQLNIINITCTCIHVSYWWVRTWKHQVEQTWQFDLALAFALCMYMYVHVCWYKMFWDHCYSTWKIPNWASQIFRSV